MAGSATEERRDFFISYTQADRAWAEWIAWQLEENGYRVRIQAWDMVPGNDWTHEVHTGVQQASRTIAVLSAAYQESAYGAAEWEAAWRNDPQGIQRKLLVFRVDDCNPTGVLASRVITDLSSLDEKAARTKVIEAARSAVSGRGKPATAPGFPPTDRNMQAQPPFPGVTPGQQEPTNPANGQNSTAEEPPSTGPTTQPRTSTDPRSRRQPPRSPRNKHSTLIVVSAVAAIFIIPLGTGIAVSVLNTADAIFRPQLTPSSGQSASFEPTYALPTISPTLPTISPLPSTSPPDPLAGAQIGECFTNDGTERYPDLQPDEACLDGDFKVLQVLADTIDISACEGVNDDWNYSDYASDQTLCFTYLVSSPIYHASVDECVFGRGNLTWWNVEPCGIGTFTVVNRFRGTASTSECGANSDWNAYFTFNGYPDLDEVLCLQMNFPLIGTVRKGRCLLESGPVSDPRFSPSPCSDANAIVTGRTNNYDDPNFCRPDDSAWWAPPGYPKLGFTVCYVLNN